MNKIPAYLKTTGRTLLAAMALCGALAACDSVVYDDEGDCAVNYRLEFRYDRNMKWADAFAQEVNSVHLYAFDAEEDTLVWQQTEKGEALAAEDYAMNLDLPAGNYRLVAWCGLENGAGSGESFSVPELYTGESYIEDLWCSLNYRRYSSGEYYSDKRLYPLFHGMLDVSLPAEEGGEHTYTMSLTKNTNHVRVILQHLSGEAVNVSDFNFRIEEDNGLMDYDNRLIRNKQITYQPYNTESGTAGLDINDYPQAGRGLAATQTPRAVTSVSVAIADLSIARLVEGRKTWLTIETGDGRTAARIPITDYALLLKDDYDHEMTDQEYLDRQDEYVLTFFLDERDKWISTSIIINSWKIVLDGVDF